MDAGKSDLVDRVMQLCAKENKPIIISLGGKPDQFVSDLVKKINKFGLKAFLLHTVSIYPTPDGKSNITYISHLKNMFENDNIKIGYSGHEIGYAPSILATLQGVRMIERHFTLSLDWNIHHLQCALTPEEYKAMNQTIDKLILESNSGMTRVSQRRIRLP
jgi:sialic acid synthase SpsE